MLYAEEEDLEGLGDTPPRQNRPQPPPRQPTLYAEEELGESPPRRAQPQSQPQLPPLPALYPEEELEEAPPRRILIQTQPQPLPKPRPKPRSGKQSKQEFEEVPLPQIAPRFITPFKPLKGRTSDWDSSDEERFENENKLGEGYGRLRLEESPPKVQEEWKPRTNKKLLERQAEKYNEYKIKYLKHIKAEGRKIRTAVTSRLGIVLPEDILPEKEENIARIARLLVYTTLFEFNEDQTKRFLTCLISLDVNKGDMVLDFAKLKENRPTLKKDSDFDDNDYFSQIVDTLTIDHPMLYELLYKIERLILSEKPTVFSESCIQEYIKRQQPDEIVMQMGMLKEKLIEAIEKKELRKAYLSLIPCEEIVEIIEFYKNFMSKASKMTFPHVLGDMPLSVNELYSKDRDSLMKILTGLSRERVKQLIDIYVHSIVDLISDRWNYYVDQEGDPQERLLVIKIHCYRGSAYSALVIILSSIGVALRFVPLVDVSGVNNADFESDAKDIIQFDIENNNDIGPSSDFFKTIAEFLYLICIGDTNMDLTEFYKIGNVLDVYKVKAETLLDRNKRTDFYQRLKTRYDPGGEKGITIFLPSEIVHIRYREMIENKLFSLDETKVPMLNLNGTFSSSLQCIDRTRIGIVSPYSTFKIKGNIARFLDTMREVKPIGFIFNWKKDLVETSNELRKMVYKEEPLQLDYSNDTIFSADYGLHALIRPRDVESEEEEEERRILPERHFKIVKHNVNDDSAYKDLQCILVLGDLGPNDTSTRYSFGMLNRIMRFDLNAAQIYEKALDFFIENETILAGIY